MPTKEGMSKLIPDEAKALFRSLVYLRKITVVRLLQGLKANISCAQIVVLSCNQSPYDDLKHARHHFTNLEVSFEQKFGAVMFSHSDYAIMLFLLRCSHSWILNISR